MNEKCLLFDFSNAMYRSYYVVPEHKRSSPNPMGGDDRPGGVYMLYLMLKKCCVNFPYPAIFALDGGRGGRRELDENYKAQRVQTQDHEEFLRQWKIALDMLHKSGATLWREEGLEADDLIANYSKQNDCYIVSADKDFDALVRPGVSLVRGSKDNSAFDEFTEESFIEKYGFEQDCFLVYKALLGDSSDNIKGVPGWGPKTSAAAIKKFGNDYHRMWKSGAGKQFDALRQDWNVFEKNLKIFAFKEDVNIDVIPANIKWDVATEYLRDLGFII